MKKDPDPPVTEIQPFSSPSSEDAVSSLELGPEVWVCSDDLADHTSGPVLPLTNGHGVPYPFLFHRLFAAMLYPHDEATRRELLVVTQRPRVRNTQDSSRLHPPGRVTELLQREVMETRWEGITAGRVIWWALWLFLQAHPASINKAVFLIQQENRQAGNPWRGPRTHEGIMRAWTDYQAVAHLWAILGGDILQDDIVRTVFTAETLKPYPKLGSILAGAEVFRRLAVPRFNLEDTWRLPPDLRVPVVRMQFLPLREWAVLALKNYRS